MLILIVNIAVTVREEGPHKNLSIACKISHLIEQKTREKQSQVVVIKAKGSKWVGVAVISLEATRLSLKISTRKNQT